MNLKLLVLALLFSVTSFAQHDEAYVNELTEAFSQSLKERGITNFFTTKRYCSGNIEMFQIDGKMCTSKGTYYEVYVIWQEEGKDFIKKIDNCGLFRTEAMEDTSLTEFYLKEYPALINDEVKPYRSEAFTGEPQLRREVQPCFREFSFINDARVDDKKFNLFALSNDSDGKNKNYAFNQTLKLVALNEKMDGLLNSLNFKRQN